MGKLGRKARIFLSRGGHYLDHGFERHTTLHFCCRNIIKTLKYAEFHEVAVIFKP